MAWLASVVAPGLLSVPCVFWCEACLRRSLAFCPSCFRGFPSFAYGFRFVFPALRWSSLSFFLVFRSLRTSLLLIDGGCSPFSRLGAAFAAFSSWIVLRAFAPCFLAPALMPCCPAAAVAFASSALLLFCLPAGPLLMLSGASSRTPWCLSWLGYTIDILGCSLLWIVSTGASSPLSCWGVSHPPLFRCLIFRSSSVFPFPYSLGSSGSAWVPFVPAFWLGPSQPRLLLSLPASGAGPERFCASYVAWNSGSLLPSCLPRGPRSPLLPSVVSLSFRPCSYCCAYPCPCS